MASTQASQTLFRFVSVRNPQLTDESGKNERFIFRPQAVVNQAGTINVFDAAVQQSGTATKWEKLAGVTPAYKSSTAYISTEAALSDFVGANLFQFSAWLARNRNSFSNSELLEKVITANTSLSTSVITQLWNNLFYQVVTQESFYIKESLIQILIAYHVVSNAIPATTEGSYTSNQVLASAKVVLPKELFLDDNNSNLSLKPFPQLPAQSIPLSRSMQKRMAVSEAKYFNTNFTILIKEVQRIEKLYWKDYQVAYDAEWKNYQQTIKPILDQYQADQEAATSSWCTNRSTAFQMDIKDPCNQPPLVPQPVIPEFVFSFQHQTEYLEENLSPANIQLVNSSDEGVYYDSKNPDADPSLNSTSINTDSFEQVYNNINKRLSQNSNTIADNTYNPVSRMISVGGVTIPVNQGESSRPSYAKSLSYQLCSESLDDYKIRFIFTMDIYVPASTYVFQSIQYKTEPAPAGYPPYTNTVNSWSEMTSDGPVIHLDDLYNSTSYPFLASDLSAADKIVGEIYFTNGAVWSFDVNLRTTYPYGKCTWGTASILSDPYEGSGDGEPPAPGSSNIFKPSGFGVKQLGVADYRKVDQSVHCYVEGEVAHIENVMAREYREKSTRRLRRSETTITASTESEREQLTDTTSTDRFEMQNEIANIFQESKDFSANAHVSGSFNNVEYGAGANFATHNSKEQSTRAAVTQAKEITERAMDRVVSRVKQERIDKIIEEFEENNKHGFDNTRGDKHVVGVYRWVDKIYKNQIYNYGKRLMFEFMIPQPAKLHLLAMKQELSDSTKTITKPIDPRTAVQSQMKSYTDASDDKIAYWAGLYNVEIEKMPRPNMSVGKSFSFSRQGDEGGNWDESFANNAEITLPAGYVSVSATAKWDNTSDSRDSNFGFRAVVGHVAAQNNIAVSVPDICENFPVSYNIIGLHAGAVNFKIDLKLTDEAKLEWRQKAFKAIIDAYEKAVIKYEEETAQQQDIADTIRESNPGFYRQVENTVLRKNCISYLIDQNINAPLTYGKPMFVPGTENSFANYEINITQGLDNYTAFAKFLEQAFEWDIMSYYFYPYYWGNRTDWQTLYQYDNNDPLFRSFMQSGLARVIVTVRPGFEDAVRFYMQTGLVWNGGEVPVIDDPLHLSIVDELRQPVGVPEGKAWATRIPTSLTILQADSIGLVVEKALPCNCDDVTPETWENPDKVPCGDNFIVSKYPLNSGAVKNLVQFSFINIDKYVVIGELDAGTNPFPREYECMGQTISIQRDAAWNATDSVVVVYQKLAEQLSYIPGVEAEQITATDGNVCGIRFRVDSSIVQDFTFIKPGGDEFHDILKVFITADSVKCISPINYFERILDKANGPLQNGELGTALPISRFKV